MIYQIVLFASSLIAPGTIILSMAGSFRVILQTSFLASYILALEPAIFFVCICMTCRQDIQLVVAAFMSGAYAFIMTLNIVGTLVTYLMGDLLNPNLLFLAALTMFFVFTGVLHPQEFTCLFPAPIFFLMVPSGYLLLTIYSLCNMHNVTWGTREHSKRKPKGKYNKDGVFEETKKKRKGLLDWLGITKLFNDVKEFYKGVAQPQGNDQQTVVMSALLTAVNNLNSRVGEEETVLPAVKTRNRKPIHEEQEQPSLPYKRRKSSMFQARDFVRFASFQTEAPIVEDPENPPWLNDSKLGDGKVRHLDEREKVFWESFIEKYLKPIDKDEEKDAKTQDELLELRTSVVMAFSMINFLWIVIIFLLQYLGEDDNIKGKLYIPIESGPNPKSIEPFGLLFLIFFTIILILQFFAAIIHRVGTLLHLIAITPLLGKRINLNKALQVFEDNLATLDKQEEVYDHVETQSDGSIDDAEEHMSRRRSKHILQRLSRGVLDIGLDDIKPHHRQRERGQFMGHELRQPQIVRGGTDILTEQFKKNLRHNSRVPGGRRPSAVLSESERLDLVDRLSECSRYSRQSGYRNQYQSHHQRDYHRNRTAHNMYHERKQSYYDA